MKEKLKEWGRNFTYLTIPVEVATIAVGLWTSLGSLVLLGSIGLGVDAVSLNVLKKDEQSRMSKTSIQNLMSKGSERFKEFLHLPRASKLAQVTT